MMNQALRLLKTFFSESICCLRLKHIVRANTFPKKPAKKPEDKTDTKEGTYVLKWETRSSENIYMSKSPNMSNFFTLLRQTCSPTRFDMSSKKDPPKSGATGETTCLYPKHPEGNYAERLVITGTKS